MSDEVKTQSVSVEEKKEEIMKKQDAHESVLYVKPEQRLIIPCLIGRVNTLKHFVKLNIYLTLMCYNCV